jgi:hypothetical protein
MFARVCIAANKRRHDPQAQVVPFRASAIPWLSTPVLGYVLFAGMRIDIHAEKLCHQQKSGRDRVLGALSISTLNVEETQTRRSPSNPL